MEESKTPHKLLYKNDTLSMSFHFLFEGLMIDFTNKSHEDIKIKWDELKMTENEIDKKVEHITIKSYSSGEIAAFQPPSIIAPRSRFTDVVAYSENVYWLVESGEETMKIKDMYPMKGNKNTTDSIQKLKGKRITLFFPIEINNVSHSWVFNFLLKDIKSKNEGAQILLSTVTGGL